MAQSIAPYGIGNRLGAPSASAIGRRMSGIDSCAIVAPSQNSTMLCTTDCGCTTTSIRSKPTSKSSCASMTSRPLFISVELSIGDLGAHVPRGVRERVGDRDLLQLFARATAERSAARGQHDARHFGRATRAQALPDRGVFGVDGDDLSPARGARLRDDRSGRDQALLVREGEALAGLQRGHRHGQSREADDGVQDDVGFRQRRQLGQRTGFVGARAHVSRGTSNSAAWRANSSESRPAARATTRYSSR